MLRGAVSGGAAFSAADRTKLDGIEALADVTDAANVAAAIVSTAAKTVIVDADTFSIIDSAASNVMKEFAWSSLKAMFNLVLPGVFRGRASVDQSLTTQDVLQDATSLSFAIAASEEWVASFYLDVGAALATTGIKIAINAPAACTINVAASLNPTIITGLNLGFGRTTTIASAIDFAAATQVATTSAGIRVDFWGLNSTNAGTIQLQFAQSTSSGTALVLRKGSYFTAYRIA